VNIIMDVGGNFEAVKVIAKHGAPVYYNGNIKAGHPSPNSTVNTAIPDGHGGWYIGGAFTSVGNSARRFLAQIDANGQVNSNLDMANGQVKSLLLSGDTLFVGGDFTGTAESFHDANGIITDANGVVLHDLTISPSTEFIRTTCADDNGGWFVGGVFTSIGGLPRNNIAQIDAIGQITSWNISIDGTVSKLKVIGNNLYISGSFTTVNGQPRAGFAVVDKNNGNVAPIIADLSSIGTTVNSFIVTGDSLILGGNFSLVNGQARNGLAIINLTTGLLHPATITPNTASITGLQLYNNRLYLSGSFTQVNGTPRNGLAAFDLTTSTLISSFTPFTAAPNITTLLLQGNMLYALGFFTSAVVGVILNLSICFGSAVFAVAEGINWFGMLLAAAAFIALYFLKADVLLVVIAGGLIGLGKYLLIG